ncbi:transglycosylase domain-containing protein [Halobacillus shinanisalinarum]|uniref:Transglycosylase domain-containing protein n=1 Tax=Halobacillus shinanisalinarum TaxID=2932258 RepID=A0ABY4H1D3_9BACI|nr:transglycosylase domain-containing protein [Halobacillus shinanisalinarum]UOQ94149.1 transglycosylase domain-containing protein [Halobacillus shinanisalinarum]
MGNKKRFDFASLKSLWERGVIQKNTRIGYDVTWNIILFFIILGVVGLFFAGGVGAGYFASLVKDEPMRSEAEMRESIYNYEETSEIYFDGENFLGNIQSNLYREEVTLDQMSKHLRHAVIATEDAYFNTHKGVVPKAVMRAVMQEVTNASVKTGGSTLTQQLVKNQILTNEVSFERKAKEMLIALRVERFFEKDEILEAYLNIVPFGRNANGQNIAGVQTAAEGIFGVSAKELSIPKAAFIAGLPQSPFAYTPFKNNGEPKSDEALQPGINRMKEVLNRMYEADYITKDQYEKAQQFNLAENLAEPTSSSLEKYPFLTNEIHRRAKEIIVEQLAKENGDTMEDVANDEALAEEYNVLAERRLSTGGFKIHTTIDQEIFDVLKEVKNNYNNYPGNRTVTVPDPESGEPVQKVIPAQVGSTVIENSTGKIKGFIAGRDFEQSQVNHATISKRSNGSTMKPLAVYGPGIDMGRIHPGSVFADVPYQYSGTNDNVGNYGGGYHGLVSARYALAKSYNVPAVKGYMRIINENPAKNYLEKMGFTTLGEDDYTNASLPLGTALVTNEENANAYAAFGNMGNFVDAYMIEKIETQDGEVFYQHESETTEVFSPQAAYLTIDMMRDVLQYGTAAGLKGQLTNPGVDWAGKTGTSQNYKDTWFVATNPNVTVSMWMGYDEEASLEGVSNYSGRNTALWADVVNAVSEIRPELMVPDSGFQRPEGIVSRSYCATSGLLASDLCSSVGLAQSDLYIAEYAPTKADDSLISGEFVRVKDNLVTAGANTPNEFIIDGGGVTLSPEFIKENNYGSQTTLNYLIPNRGAWDKVALPSSGSLSTSSSIENDGSNPAVPGSVSANSSTISWSASSSNDVVGYRVFKASEPGGAFSLIGNTTETSFNFSGGDGVYAVRAVDYYGQSSGNSSTVQVGKPGRATPEPKPEGDPKPEEESEPSPDSEAETQTQQEEPASESGASEESEAAPEDSTADNSETPDNPEGDSNTEQSSEENPGDTNNQDNSNNEETEPNNNE